MSDTDKPTEPTTPPAEQPTPAKPPREKPPQPAGRVPSLQHEQSYGFGKRIDAFDEEMERQLQEAMSGMSDKDLYGEPARERRRGKETPDDGPKKGKVFRIHGQDVFIDLPGGRTQGVLPLLQFPEGPPAIGTEIEITIEGFDHANGVLILSRKGAAVEADWSSVAAGMTVEARVTATNKGGLSVDVNGIRGFMPISQIDLYRVEDAEQFVNQRLLCLVTEVDPVERNLVVSRRALLEKQREEMRDKLWNELAEGQVRQGVVRSIKDFGAFVDLGGVDGLLHVSEMSWQRVQDPSTIVQLGQTVKVVVLKIDAERRKVSLGLKQLTASPWDNITEKYHTGDVVTGKVSRLMDFGAFVELEPAIEGLIHISELAGQRVFRVGDIVKAGQEVQVKVLSVDPAQRRISLSLKAAQAKAPEPEVEEEPEAEPEVPAKPPRPRTTPLRGGTGSGSGQLFQLPQPPSTDKA
ncbi:MAG TPA: S1 RNA-binding domain-containing protein [Gemmataceae bacterium]|jgi:small subunit ribosomal protein S1